MVSLSTLIQSYSCPFILQGRLCYSSRTVTTTGAGVSSGTGGSVGIRSEESTSSAGTVELTRGSSHLQQSLLCAAELERPQVTYTVHSAGESRLDLFME